MRDVQPLLDAVMSAMAVLADVFPEPCGGIVAEQHRVVEAAVDFLEARHRGHRVDEGRAFIALVQAVGALPSDYRDRVQSPTMVDKFWHHHHRHHDDARRVIVSLAMRVGDPAHKLQAAALDAAGDADPNNPTFTWTEDSNGAVVSIADNGDGTCTVTAVAAGSATVTADAKDPDGHDQPSAPFAIVVAENTDATSVTITDLGPVS